MFKKIPFLTVLLVSTLMAGVAFAAVVIYSEGTRVGPTDKMLLVGPTVSESGGRTTVDSTAMQGPVTVDDDLYSDAGLMADGSLYLTGGSGNLTYIYLRQSDGGCSQCNVDAAGTTFTCVDASCPAGMTR